MPRHQNPFRYGQLALDEAFTDRERETRELVRDLWSGQNVVLFAPRRYGKSSLVWRAAQQLIAEEGMRVAHVDLLATPSKEKFAEKLAATIYEDVAPPLARARDRVTSLFGGLRISPSVTFDTAGGISFSFAAGHAPQDVDATLERLFELPAQLAAEHKLHVAIVFDEFQEIVALDPRLPALMRSVFQRQPEVAHVYLGSKRKMMNRLFNDENEPFWRSAKQMEIGPIDPNEFVPFIEAQFARTDRGLATGVIDNVLTITRGHPYATQELCYFLWDLVPEGFSAMAGDVEDALAAVLRSEHAHFSRVWEDAARGQRLVLQALAAEPHTPISEEYRRRHNLPPDATVRKALRTLGDDEIVTRDVSGYRIAEPFLAEWILRNES
ncbi:MAG: AAA family ATPase [Gaiellaceae bacterium]